MNMSVSFKQSPFMNLEVFRAMVELKEYRREFDKNRGIKAESMYS